MKGFSMVLSYCKRLCSFKIKKKSIDPRKQHYAEKNIMTNIRAEFIYHKLISFFSLD